MPLTILLTGFGPFPGAPFNPTGPLVKAPAARYGRPSRVRCVAHVFATRYEAVDSELPRLIARERPDLVIMFGLAQRTKHLRIETCARNVRSRIHPDAGGHRPIDGMIALKAPAIVGMRVCAGRLVAAVRAAGLPAAPSRDAGSYLCNYLCWRASEAANLQSGPRLVAFVHVPLVRPGRLRTQRRSARPATLGDLVAAGEAIVQAAVGAARR